MIKLSEGSGIKGPDEQLSLLDGLLDRKGLMENGHQNCMKEVEKCMDALLRSPEVHAWEGISRLINFWSKHQEERDIESVLVSCLSSPLLPLATTSKATLTMLQSLQPLSRLRITCLLLPTIIRVLESGILGISEQFSHLIVPEIILGLRNSRDPQTRSRSLHLLKSLPPSLMVLPGLETDELWGSFTSLMQVLDNQRVLHLIQPPWDSLFPTLFHQSQHQSQWLRIVLSRSFFHSNINVRRMALASFLDLGLKALKEDPSISHEEMLLYFLSAFDHEKVVETASLRDQLVNYLTAILQRMDLVGKLKLIIKYLSEVMSVIDGQTIKLASMRFLSDALLVSLTDHLGNKDTNSDEADEIVMELHRTTLRFLTTIDGMNPLDCKRETQAILISIFTSASFCQTNIRSECSVRRLHQLMSIVAAALPSPSSDHQLSDLTSRQRVDDERLLVKALESHPRGLFELLSALEWSPESQQEVLTWAAGLLNDKGYGTAPLLLLRSLVIFISPCLNASFGISPRFLCSTAADDGIAAWLTQCLAESHEVWAGQHKQWHQAVSINLLSTLLPRMINSQIKATKACVIDKEWDRSLLAASMATARSIVGIKADTALDDSISRLQACLLGLNPSSSHYLVTLCLLLSIGHSLDPTEATLMSVCDLETSDDHCLSLRALARKLILRQLTCSMSTSLFLTCIKNCILDLDWASDQCLEDTIEALTLTLNHLPNDLSGESDHELVEVVRGMVRDLPHVMVQASKGGKVAGSLAPRVIGLLFHSSLFVIKSVKGLLIEETVPMVLRGGMGVRMSFLLAGHLGRMTIDAFERGQPINDYLCPQRVTSFIAHGTFTVEDSHSSHPAPKPPSVVGKMKKKQLVAFMAPEVLLPSRVALCAALDTLADRGHHDFIDLAARCLLTAVKRLGAGREGGQSSHINSAKIRSWQALCLIAKGLSFSASIDLLSQVWQSCLIESTTEQPNVRPLIQLFVTRLFLRDKNSITTLLVPALRDYGRASYQVSVSVCLVALHLISELQREDQGSSGLSDHLLKALLPWSLHHRHAVRVPIQVMLSRVCQRDGNQDEFMQPICQFLVANAEMNKMLSGSTKMALDASSIDASMSFLGLFSCLPNINCDGEDDLSGLEWPLHARDRLPLDLVSLVPALLKKLNRASYHRSAARDNTSSALMPKSYEDANGVEVEEGEGEDEEDTSTFHQLRPTLDMDLNLQEEAADKAEALVKARSCTKGLVVVASLLHNLPNVAGLCRTCESMSCEALVVPSKVLVQSDEFLRQSVTSERWLRLLEVTPQDLPAFLAERKADGYTIVAVEQAQGSISLQHYSFPRQCVMVLGNEQNGVPSSILTLVDACVEIPMLGVTRSMNAHVTGAMCVWSYVQQHQLT